MIIIRISASAEGVSFCTINVEVSTFIIHNPDSSLEAVISVDVSYPELIEVTSALRALLGMKNSAGQYRGCITSSG